MGHVLVEARSILWPCDSQRIPKTTGGLKEYPQELENTKKRLLKKGFPDRCGEIANLLEVSKLDFVDEMLSINRVKWRRYRLLVKPPDEGEEYEVGPGSFVKANSKIHHDNVCRMNKAFKAGERLVFDPKEFHDMCYTAFLFCDCIRQQIQRLIADKKERGEFPRSVRLRS